jgi:hypothetical protein
MTVPVTGNNISKVANRRIDVLARRKQHDQRHNHQQRDHPPRSASELISQKGGRAGAGDCRPTRELHRRSEL